MTDAISFEVFWSSRTKQCKLSPTKQQYCLTSKTHSQCLTGSISLQCGVTIFLCSGVACRLPRELSACASSVHQPLFSSPPLHKSLEKGLASLTPDRTLHTGLEKRSNHCNSRACQSWGWGQWHSSLLLRGSTQSAWTPANLVPLHPRMQTVPNNDQIWRSQLRIMALTKYFHLIHSKI